MQRRQAIGLQAGESDAHHSPCAGGDRVLRDSSPQLRAALRGESKAAILATVPMEPLSGKVAALARGDYASKPIERIDGIGLLRQNRSKRRSGALRTPNPFEDAVLAATNLATTPTPPPRISRPAGWCLLRLLAAFRRVGSGSASCAAKWFRWPDQCATSWPAPVVSHSHSCGTATDSPTRFASSWLPPCVRRHRDHRVPRIPPEHELRADGRHGKRSLPVGVSAL